MLIDSEDSVLVVVDVQDHFLGKLSDAQRQPLLDRITWLIKVAERLGIPIVVTAEDISSLGGSCQQIVENLPVGVTDHNKLVFGLAGDKNTLSAVKQTNKNTAVLVGLETDVCICHSALGLLERGYKVAVIEDATCSPGVAHAQGIQRMRDDHVIITSTKGIFYEWIRTVKNADKIKNLFEGKILIP